MFGVGTLVSLIAILILGGLLGMGLIVLAFNYWEDFH